METVCPSPVKGPAQRRFLPLRIRLRHRGRAGEPDLKVGQVSPERIRDPFHGGVFRFLIFTQCFDRPA